MTNFIDSFYFQNYNIFKKTRSILDGYLIHRFLKWNVDIENYLEIGIFKGATFSIIAETNNKIKCFLVDDNMKNFKDTIPKNLTKNTTCFEKKSIDMNWNSLPNFDFIMWDGSPIPPTPLDDIVKCVSRSNNNTVLGLGWVNYPGMDIVKNFLKKEGWTQWIKLDSCQLWSKKSLQPFIDHLIYEKNGLFNFSRIHKGNNDEDYKWLISAPQCVYDNVQITEKYIRNED